MEQIEAL